MKLDRQTILLIIATALVVAASIINIVTLSRVTALLPLP